MRQDGPTRLRLIREALGLTQAEVARRTGIDQSLISRAERGLIETWPKFRRETSEALGIPESVLFGEPDPERPRAA